MDDDAVAVVDADADADEEEEGAFGRRFISELLRRISF